MLLPTAPFGLVLYLYFLAPYVLLDNLRVLNNVLADTDLFLYDRALLHNDLFLYDRYNDLVLADLSLRSLSGERHPLHVHLFPLDGHLYLLMLGADSLAHPEGAGLALLGADPELLLGALHPELLFVGRAGGACRALPFRSGRPDAGASLGGTAIVRAIGPALCSSPLCGARCAI